MTRDELAKAVANGAGYVKVVPCKVIVGVEFAERWKADTAGEILSQSNYTVTRSERCPRGWRVIVIVPTGKIESAIRMVSLCLKERHVAIV